MLVLLRIELPTTVLEAQNQLWKIPQAQEEKPTGE